jgi:hypothetical protein
LLQVRKDAFDVAAHSPVVPPILRDVPYCFYRIRIP